MDGAHHEWLARLSDYLADDLGASDRVAVEAHLSTCASCNRALEDLARVVAQAGALDDLDPPAHLWAGIAEAIDGTKPGSVLPFPAPRHATAGERGLSRLTWPRLAAAAIVLMTATASVSWWVGSTRAEAQGAAATQGAEVVMVAGDVPAPPAGLAEELAALEEILASARTVLDPNTVRVVERSLSVIEQAISDSREALLQDPGNAFLAEHLDRMYRRKLVYLQDAVRLVELGG